MEKSEGSSLEQEAAALLGRVLDAVYAGEMTADGPAGKALVQHLEGSLIGIKTIDELRQSH